MDKVFSEEPAEKGEVRRDAAIVATYRTYVKKRVVLKERRDKRKQQKLFEYRRLRSMVPSLSRKPKVSKITVIEEAIRYIDQLHNALLTRLKTRGLPRCMQGMNIDVNSLRHNEIKNLVCQVMSNSPSSPSTSQRPVSLLFTDSIQERNRVIPSYMIRKQRK
ncbi:uncharacterized protein LOC143223268 [Tachypleus tridentatus]|uniref:uncharacterized protein LOC143223268 n=1 Tax=Tachypleus tridentatus TaxID=6853 RepID=UPI003FD1E810